jgi:anthranilate phosphoribosyltransferase
MQLLSVLHQSYFQQAKSTLKQLLTSLIMVMYTTEGIDSKLEFVYDII